jgi:sulfur-oxidizing protein SoxY
MTRRVMLRAAGWLGLAALAVRAGLAPSTASAQGMPKDLVPEEKVEDTLRRLFGNRPIKDAGGVIKLDLPLIAENGAVVPITVAVTSPMTPADHVKAIYIIADKNRRPMNAKFSFVPLAGAAAIGTNLRLGESTDVRAIAEMNNGTLLQAKREVKVTVGGCGG